MTDTIFAPITGRGGAITVLRLSGPAALGITSAFCARLPPPLRARCAGLMARCWTMRSKTNLI